MSHTYTSVGRSIFLALSAALAFAALFTPALAEGERRALLVGVSNYSADRIGFDASLEGPANDIALMSRTLKRLNFPDRNVVILSDQVDATAIGRPANNIPTRRNIMAALASLVAATQSGDQVLIYLSGHGSQQPERDPQTKTSAENDGLDEVFLPIDVGRWDDAQATIENAILDDEFGEVISKLSDRGASLWFIADACHSGDITRGAFGPNARFISGSDLGIPANRLVPQQTTGAVLRGGEPTQTTFESIDMAPNAIGFFAAQPGELALERTFPKSLSAPERRVHGMLTYYLTRSMNRRDQQTYRNLAEDVVAGFDEWGSAAPRPQFKGDLNRPILTGGASGWTLFNTSQPLGLDAGLLDGLEVGAIVKLVRSGEADGSKHLYARVQQINGTQSTLSVIDYNGIKAPALPLPLPIGDWRGLLEQPARSSVLTFAGPRRSPDLSDVESATLEIIETLRDTLAGNENSRIKIASHDSDTDQVLYLENDILWFLEPSQRTDRLNQTQLINLTLKSYASAFDLSSAILETMERVSHARNLVQAASKLSRISRQQPLSVTFFLRPHGNQEMKPSKTKMECDTVSTRSVPADAALISPEDLAPGQRLTLSQCDVIYLKIRNLSPDTYIDLTPLYLDSAAKVKYVGDPNRIRLAPNADPFILPLTILASDPETGKSLSTGLERLLLLAIERTDVSTPITDFRHLTSPDRGNLRGGGEDPATSMFIDASIGGSDIRLPTPEPSPKESANALIYSWIVSEER